jgi:hypothetical protein
LFEKNKATNFEGTLSGWVEELEDRITRLYKCISFSTLEQFVQEDVSLAFGGV